jgi:hypothetical protein
VALQGMPPTLGREREASSYEPSGSRGSDIVGVGRDAGTHLLVASVHVRVVLLDVPPSEAEKLLVVGTLEVMPAGTVDRSHVYLFRL